MKLIIDIPEREYKVICENNYVAVCACPNLLSNAIKDGTPIPDNATNVLDAIKLEIKQEYDKQGDWSFNDGLVFALEIIDKYAKENRNEQM